MFIAGCGRFFEGVGAEMIAALDYLGTLPDETIVYNGHEYTGGSLAFGKHVDPSNVGLAKLAEIAKKNKITTGLTTIGDEKEWNVFMRLDSEAVKYVRNLLMDYKVLRKLKLSHRTSTEATADTPKSVIMDKLREQKNNYRG